jgi:hypothetical protein
MSFFRRLLRPKDAPSEEPGDPATPASDDEIIWSDENRPTPVEERPYEGTPAEPEGPEPVAPEVAPAPAPEPIPTVSPTVPAPAPVAPPAPTGPPPPLPRAEAPTAVARPVTPVPFSLCFVCGTPLEGKHCPKCKMTWVE